MGEPSVFLNICISGYLYLIHTFICYFNDLLISVYPKSFYSYTYYLGFMAGVLAQIGWPWGKRPEKERRTLIAADRPNGRAIELETAKEILQEVFGTTSSEVEEMILLRLAERAIPEGEAL